MKIMAAEYGFQGFIAAVARLTLSGNAITDYGKDLTGLKALCEVLPSLKNPISLDLANCNFKVAEVNELAQAIDAGAALTKIDIRGADFHEKVWADLKNVAPEGCQVLWE